MSLGPVGRAGRRIDLLVLGLLSALLFLPWSGARDLWNPNEPLYGRAVVEMQRSGDWSAPRVNGLLFDEKPILYFWLALASSALLGRVDELSLRLPAALSGVAAVLLVYLLVYPYAGRRRAQLAAAILATTFGVFWSSRVVQMDLLLTACTLGVLVPLSRMLDHRGRASRCWSLAGLAAGLGFLAKGPVALVCAGFPVLAYAAGTRRVRELVRPSIGLGLASFVAIALPWYVLLAREGGSAALFELLYRQNVVRFFEPWDHQAPWWYFLEYFWIDMAPWALFVPLAWGLSPLDEGEERLHRLCWIWIGVLVLFFSLSQSKRSAYILPVAPASAILVAALMERWLRDRLTSDRLLAGRLLLGTIALLLVGCGTMLIARADRLTASVPELRGLASALALLLLGAGLAVGMALVLRRARRAAPAVLFSVVLAIYGFTVVWALPAANRFKSHRGLCREIVRHVAADRPLVGYRFWKWRAGYSYYSDRSIPNLESLDELREYWNRPDAAFVIVERAMLDEARRVLGDREPLVTGAVGSNVAFLFGNPASRVHGPSADRTGTGAIGD